MAFLCAFSRASISPFLSLLCRMDYIRKYDIELEKEQYYAGEMLRGWVVIENAENLRITGLLISVVRVNRIIESIKILPSVIFLDVYLSIDVFVAGREPLMTGAHHQ